MKEVDNMRTIYFDMDGTIANLYGVEGWLDDLINSRVRPYAEATPMLNFSVFARQLHRLQNCGYRIGIVSWLSKSGTEEYNARVTETKKEWLAKHLPSVEWDEINIVAYGTPKSTVVSESGILFDDEIPNRKEWNLAFEDGMAFDVKNILEILRSLR